MAVERGVTVPDLELGFCVIDNVFQSVKSAAETKSNPRIVPGKGRQAIQQSLAIANKGFIHIQFMEPIVKEITLSESESE